jgi:hypothetical protein
MTITIKARTAALALALLCVLAGLAIGQLTQAQSAGSGTPQLGAINSKLGKISGQLGASQFGGGLSAELGELGEKLKAIAKSTKTTCEENTRYAGVC